MNKIARFVARLTQQPPELKDWPQPLRANAAAAKLAPALYKAWHEVAHGSDPVPWMALHQAIRHTWVQLAEAAIRGVKRA